MCASIHGADDCCWYVPFTLWICGSGLASLGHDLHVRMHPVQATQYPLDGVVLGRFGRSAQDRSNALWCVPLSMELTIGADMVCLPSVYVAVD